MHPQIAIAIYIGNMLLDGAQYTRNYITHESIMRGGVMDLQMEQQPNRNRGVGDDDAPYSFSNTK